MSSSAHRPSTGPHHNHHYVTTTPHPPSATNTAATSVSQPSTTPSIHQQARSRQYTHLHAQLAQLNAHLADTENLLHMTAVQAEYVRGLGAWWGAGFMAASKILGEEMEKGEEGEGKARKQG